MPPSRMHGRVCMDLRVIPRRAGMYRATWFSYNAADVFLGTTGVGRSLREPFSCCLFCFLAVTVASLVM